MSDRVVEMSDTAMFSENSPRDLGTGGAAPSMCPICFSTVPTTVHYQPDEEEARDVCVLSVADIGYRRLHATAVPIPLVRRVHSHGISTPDRDGSLESSGGISTSRCLHQLRVGPSCRGLQAT